MIEGEINLVRLIDGAIRDLRHRLTKRLEVVNLRLIRKNVSVDEKQDALLHASLLKPPDDLKGGVSFARPGRHDEKDPILTARDRVNRSVDSYLLIVARRLTRTVIVVILRRDALLFWRLAFGVAIA